MVVPRVLPTLPARLGFADPRQVVEWGPDGVRLRPSCDLTDDAAACIAEITESIVGDNRNLKVKFHDKRGALDSLAKHLGMFVERKEVSGPGGGPISLQDLSGLTDAELEARIRVLEAGADP